jgi:hypothetical protein
MRKAVEKGKSMMPESWYRTGPLYDVFMEELGPDTAPTAYKRFMELVSATSPQSRVPDNVRIASYYNYLDRNGLELPETPAPGYGAKAQILHRQNVVDMQNGGLDPLKNPKPSSFVENLLGNETPVTVDTHNFRLLGILSKDPRFLATKTDTGFNPRQAFADGKITIEQALQNPTWWDSAPLKTEYAAYEAYQQKLANKLGMTPAEFQEKMWVGAGDKTGLGSPPETWLRTFARRVQYTAARLNADPDVVMRKFIRGEIPLLGVGGAAALGGLSDGAPDTNEPHR